MTAESRPDLRLVHDADAPGNDLDRIVYDAEFVDDDPPAEPEPELEPEPEPGNAVAVRRRLPLVQVQPSERTVAIARGAGAAGVTVLRGWHSWAVRAYDALTLGVYREQIRLARVKGDREALADWTDRKRQAAQERRRMLAELPGMLFGLVKVGVLGLLGLVVAVPVVALLVWLAGGDGFAVFRWVRDALRWTFDAIAFLWPWFVTSLPVAFLVGGWREGNRSKTALAWTLGSPNEPGDPRGVIPNEGAIVKALSNIGLTPLNQAIKAGWQPRFVQPTVRDGKGWRTQLELPQGVTVEMINDKKKVLAHNLVRFPIEVWPTEPKTQPGVLDLWVADQGSLTGKVPDWPLLAKGTSDYFKGVPCAIDIRGNVVKGLLSEKNYAFAGMMGSGKSTMIITLVLGAMLDPLVEVDVFVLAENADFTPMKPRLRTLVTGTDDEIVHACLDTMRDLYGDLTIRGRALKEHGVRAVNRDLAERDPRLRPRILVVDECQALFMHPELGEEAADLTVQLISAARKYGVTLMFATPEPSTDSLPRKVMAVTSNKACFAIGDQRSNDAILGTGSYTSGISAVSLEPKTEEGPGDIGTCMARGFQPKPGLLRSYYVDEKQVPPVIERAMALRAAAGVSSARTVAPDEPRDLLADISEVLGEETVPCNDLPALLARLAPNWKPYRSLTGKQLRADLEEMGVKVPSTGNRYPVSPGLIAAALTRRDADEDGS